MPCDNPCDRSCEVGAPAARGVTACVIPSLGIYSITYLDARRIIGLIDLNGVHIEAYPSHHLDAMRGLSDVFFFAYSQQNDGSSILDAVRWAYIPPPEFIISTSPRVVNITAGEKETIEVELNSTTGLNPFVHFNTNNGHSGMHLGFEYPDRQVPSYGIATTPMVISITNNVSVGPQTVSILGNLTFPTQTFDSPIKNTKKGVIKIESEHVMTQTTFTVNIQNPLTPQQQLKIWLDEWFNPLTGTWTAIAAIISGILGWRTWNTHRSKDGGETSQKSTTITYSNVRPHK
jgi:hypothetical protein